MANRNIRLIFVMNLKTNIMKKLSLVFGIIAILFMLLGLYEIFTLSDLSGYLTFTCFMGGFLSSALFIITDKLSNKTS